MKSEIHNKYGDKFLLSYINIEFNSFKIINIESKAKLENLGSYTKC